MTDLHFYLISINQNTYRQTTPPLSRVAGGDRISSPLDEIRADLNALEGMLG